MGAKHSLGHGAILLTLAGGVEFGLQLAIPMIFVRQLDPATFGQYRLLWLMAATALSIAPAFMPQSLYYFMPRSPAARQPVYIGNVLAYLAVAGAVVALLTSGINPLLPAKVRELFGATHGLSSLFLWGVVVVSIMTTLPTAEGRMRWQAGADLGLAVLRTVLLAGAAIFTHQIGWVAAAMLAEALARFAMFGLYLSTRPGGPRVAPEWAALVPQLRYALPFALGNALFMLRVQSDQWVAAAMLPTALFGMFTIGVVFLPFASLVRQPVNNALMPRLNKAFAEGDLAGIARLVRKSSAAVTLILVPASCALACLAPELVQIVYTSRYAAAVPVMQMYLIGLTLHAVAIGHALPALAHGRFAAVNNACCLALSIGCSIAGASRWGMAGAACGSVLALAVSELWSLLVVARTLQVAPSSLLPWGMLLPCWLGSALAAAALWLLHGAIGGSAALVLAAKGLVFVAVFAAVFFAAGGKAQLQLFFGGRTSNDTRSRVPDPANKESNDDAPASQRI
jgi:O-antigen/teichoic acid export membrane protein